MRLLLFVLLTTALPALAHDGHSHVPLEGPLHHLVGPAIVLAVVALAAFFVRRYTRRDKD